MKLALITAGAAGMYCGSCMHDNTLAAALIAEGHDALLIPTYTPITTDEVDVSQQRVFFGGINVYLQEKSALFRHTPWLMDRLLDVPRLLRWVGRFAANTDYSTLGGLTISMLEGTHGHQRKEVEKLVGWLAEDVKPDLISLTNVLLSGIIPELKTRLGVPILATLQGDDIFLEGLRPADRAKCIELIRRNCQAVDGYVVTSRYYADFMASYLGLPRERMHVVLPGLNLKGHGGELTYRAMPPYTIGYFARICPEKGLHVLCEAFRLLRAMPGCPPCKLRVSGWLGGTTNMTYLRKLMRDMDKAGLGGDVEYVESPGHDDKVRFLRSLDVMSVPTTYREPKGLYLLEAWANGVPVVQPRHGSFPELIEATGGGLLVKPDDPADLAVGLRRVLEDVALRQRLGRAGQKAVYSRFTAAEMAKQTAAVFRRYMTDE